MSYWREPTDDAADDWSPIGSPRPEPADLMTARQLVNAFVDARTPEDRAYAVDEAESFLVAGEADVSDEALLAFLDLPATELTLLVLDSVVTDLADRAPRTVPALLGLSLRARETARQNAAIVLERLSLDALASGLIAVLRDLTYPEPLRVAAAERLIGLGRPAAIHILDALVESEPRAMISEVAGCPADADDAEVMRSLDDLWRSGER